MLLNIRPLLNSEMLVEPFIMLGKVLKTSADAASWTKSLGAYQRQQDKEYVALEFIIHTEN